jgi:hypothetical protein
MTDQLTAKIKLLDMELLKQVWTVLKKDPAELDLHSRKKRILMVADEIRSVSGHSIGNFFRMMGGFKRSYHEILVDVALNIAPSTHKDAMKRICQNSTPPHEIEIHILTMLDERLKLQWEQLSEEKRDQEVEKIRNAMKTTLARQGKPIGEEINQELTTKLLTQAIMKGMFIGGGFTLLLSTVTVLGVSVGLSTLVSSFGAFLIYYFLGSWAATTALWSGGAATLGATAIAAPAVALIAANTLASPGYSKLIPAMILILSSPKAMADREKYL